MFDIKNIEEMARLEKAPTGTVTVRMPAAKIAKLKAKAQELGVDHLTLVKKLIEAYIGA